MAERLIVLGFFDDLLQRLPVSGLRGYLGAAVARKLGASSAGSAHSVGTAS
jgi:hypothetical protein